MYKSLQSSAKTDDLSVWSQLQDHNIVPINKFIYNIDIDLNTPFKYAVVTEKEIPIYSCETNATHTNLPNLTNASCCKFRSDGQMIIIGTKSGDILLVSPKMPGKILNSFSAHKAEITKIEYLYKYDPVQKQSASISDDGTLQIWNILTNSRIQIFANSKEPLRGLALTKSNPDLIATGSLDGFIRVYDIAKNNAPTIVIDTRCPVNCLLFPLDSTSDFILSAGKSSISLWNISCIEVDGDNQPIPAQTITPHHMQITDICASDAFDNGERVIFTSGLDGMVKVISLADFREIQKYEYPSSLMSIKVLPKSQFLVVGGNSNLNDMKSCIYTRKLKSVEADKDISKPGIREKEQQKIFDLTARYCSKDEAITVFPHKNKIKSSKYEKLLRQHKHRSLLAVILQDRELETKPELFRHLIQELGNLNALKRSIATQKDVKLPYLLRYIRHFISMPTMTYTCVRLIHIVLEIFPTDMLARHVEYAKLMKIMSRSVKKWKRLDQAIVDIKDVILSCQYTHFDTEVTTPTDMEVDENRADHI